MGGIMRGIKALDLTLIHVEISDHIIATVKL